MNQSREPSAFRSQWPNGIEEGKPYKILCDDKGRLGGTWLCVIIDSQGDAHLCMQDWEEIPEGKPTPFPTLRVRTSAGGGRNRRTRQALLWLADAIRRDNEENGATP